MVWFAFSEEALVTPYSTTSCQAEQGQEHGPERTADAVLRLRRGRSWSKCRPSQTGRLNDANFAAWRAFYTQ